MAEGDRTPETTASKKTLLFRPGAGENKSICARQPSKYVAVVRLLLLSSSSAP